MNNKYQNQDLKKKLLEFTHRSIFLLFERIPNSKRQFRNHGNKVADAYSRSSELNTFADESGAAANYFHTNCRAFVNSYQ